MPFSSIPSFSSYDQFSAFLTHCQTLSVRSTPHRPLPMSSRGSPECWVPSQGRPTSLYTQGSVPPLFVLRPSALFILVPQEALVSQLLCVSHFLSSSFSSPLSTEFSEFQLSAKSPVFSSVFFECSLHFLL